VRFCRRCADELPTLCPPQATGHRVTRAPPSSLSEAVLKPHLQLSPLRRPPQSKPKMSTFFRRGRLNIDRTSLATPDPPATPLSSARVPHSSTSHQPVPLTTGSSPSLLFPIVDPHCHGQSVPMRLRPPAALNRKPVGLGLVPDPFPTGRRPSAGRILPGITGAKEGENPLFLVAVGRRALWT
jgi:hypothetical protein